MVMGKARALSTKVREVTSEVAARTSVVTAMTTVVMETMGEMRTSKVLTLAAFSVSFSE